MSKKLLKLLMILLIVGISVSCVTKVPTQTIKVPVFSSSPTRPILESIPTDTTEAIRSLTKNMSLLADYAERLEAYIHYQGKYYQTVIEIITK